MLGDTEGVLSIANSDPFHRLIIIFVLVFGVLGGSGCSLYSSKTAVMLADAEGRVPRQVYEDIGATRMGKKGLIKQLGLPVHQEAISQTGSLYTWALTRNEERETRFIFLYHTKKTTRNQVYLHVVFSGNSVLKHWMNQDLHVDIDNDLTAREKAIAFNSSAQDSPSLIVPNYVPPVTTVIQAAEN